jgi:signal transduction histidine kinase
MSADDLVTETCELFESTAEASELALSWELPAELPPVIADAPRIQQVLSNLLVNAIKFTPPGGSVHVSARVEPDQSRVRISVRDTGPGIAREDVPRLFERYWQAPRLLRAGSGLGLFIAKGIVEAHRGEINVETAIGSGTTMSFTLPTV